MNLTIISGSARENNRTLAVARRYFELCVELGFSINLIDLGEIPVIRLAEMAQGLRGSEHLRLLQNLQMERVLVFVLPEYNGSFPGMLKLFIDAMPQQDWRGKKAALLGVSSGRSGNLRGLDHLTAVLHYLDVTVLPKRITIDRVAGYINDGQFLSEAYDERMRQQLLLLKDF